MAEGSGDRSLPAGRVRALTRAARPKSGVNPRPSLREPYLRLDFVDLGRWLLCDARRAEARREMVGRPARARLLRGCAMRRSCITPAAHLPAVMPASASLP